VITWHRTTKVSVKNELTIPEQTRYLVPVELGKIERQVLGITLPVEVFSHYYFQVYDQTFERALEELGLDARGVAASEGWEVDVALLRSWMRKLRGIATHPQVGQLFNQADKLHKRGVLKSIGEVLEGMCEQNWRNLMDDRKKRVGHGWMGRGLGCTKHYLQIECLIKSGQLQQHAEREPKRYQLGLDFLVQAEQEAEQLVNDMKATLVAHDAKGELMKQEAITLHKVKSPAMVGITHTNCFKGEREGTRRQSCEHEW
jgi:E3 ubiquitin-protein ligase SHPRH